MLYIIRGISGSGKSTKAKEIEMQKISDGLSVGYYEADMFFMLGDDYLFDASQLQQAHSWCLSKVKSSLTSNDVTIVANTFTRAWEVQPYIDLARRYNVPFEVITCTGNYENVHNVPDEIVKKQKMRFEQLSF